MLLSGLIGWPLGHSRSPALHNAAYAEAGIEGMYALMPVRAEAVARAITGLIALGFRGSNVTIPHKQTVIPYLDELSPAARAIGAVNTIVIGEEGHLFGDNTDAPGFMAALAELDITVEELKEGGVLLLGAGGSARAVAYALASAGIHTHILARRLEQAQQLVTTLRPYLKPVSPLRPLSSPLSSQTNDYRLIVNCTPVGMSPKINASPWPVDVTLHQDQIVYDLVYNPSDTQFMAQARSRGALAFNGLGMLLHQGALAWEMWTGQPAPIDAMRSVFF